MSTQPPPVKATHLMEGRLPYDDPKQFYPVHVGEILLQIRGIKFWVNLGIDLIQLYSCVTIGGTNYTYVMISNVKLIYAQ